MKLNAATKQRFAIEFWRWIREGNNRPGKLVHGIITGRHASNRNLLINWDGQKGIEQESFWGERGGKFLKLDDAGRTHYAGLQSSLAKAEAAVEEFHAMHRFDPREVMGKDARE